MSVIDVTRLSEQQVGVSREFDDFRTRPGVAGIRDGVATGAEA